MTELFEIVIIALACPLALPLLVDLEVQNEPKQHD